MIVYTTGYCNRLGAAHIKTVARAIACLSKQIITTCTFACYFLLTSLYSDTLNMSTPKFAIYPGLGEWAKENLHYSQAVRIGNIVKISGQGQTTSRPQSLRPPN